MLGAGGFGITYLAYDANLDRKVAIKEFFPRNLVVRKNGIEVVPGSEAQGDIIKNGLDRFALEGQTLVNFKHPSIVSVFHFFKANGTAYLVMEYVIGVNLTMHIKQHKSWFHGVRFTNEEIFRFIRHLCSGLHLMHAAKIIHRDIKPANIIIRSNGKPVLLDFGAARQFMLHQGRDAKMTVIATPANAPPEQFMEDGDQGPWTDIYALGTVLFQMLTDTAPPSSGERIKELMANRPDPMVSVAKTLSGRYAPRLLAAIDRALAIDYEQRPKDIPEWLQYLRAPEETQLAVTQTQAAQTRSPHPFLAILSQKKRCLMVILLVSSLLAPLFCLSWQFVRERNVTVTSPVHPAPIPATNLQEPPPLQTPPSPQSVDRGIPGNLFSLTVVTSPKEARVRILNISPRYQPGMKLPQGSYHIEVSLPGFQSIRQWVNLEHENQILDVKLQKE
ncbi:MAG: serine/threonine protein kinase [Magnetococcales bacterium]|nr:serine/threonine protein kinase [Magnetococcales bacterium]